jgi:hypothetical protein
MVGVIRDENNGNPVERDLQLTPERATAMLPLVRRIVAELTRLSQSIATRRLQVEGVSQLQGTSSFPAYQEELNDIHSTIEQEEERLRECLLELTSLGIEPHYPIDGSVDFPASLNRRGVRLCWNPNDDAVIHWHEVGEPATDRKRIDPQTFGTQNMN